jgi:hypothetical protein
VGIYGSLSLLFMTKVMVWDVVSDTHNVVTTLIIAVVVLVLLELTDLQIIVVDFSLQSHRYVYSAQLLWCICIRCCHLFIWMLIFRVLLLTIFCHRDNYCFWPSSHQLLTWSLDLVLHPIFNWLD